MQTGINQKTLKLRNLPPHLQKKYKHSILFEKQNLIKPKKYELEISKIKQGKLQKLKTLEEKLQEYILNPTQEKYLNRVFTSLAASNNGQYFTRKQISEVLKKMNIRMTNSQIEKMIWEFDERLNNKISYSEFLNMYKKCTIDKAAFQSKNLFHLTQFLMFCRPNYYHITVEDTLELSYVRSKIKAQVTNCDQKQLLQAEIKAIFGDEEKTAEGLDKQIGFSQYLEKINKRAIQNRKEEVLKVKSKLKY